MTFTSAYTLAREAANILQVWYEIWRKEYDYQVIHQGGKIEGYEHYMSISPERKIDYGTTTETIS